MKTAISLPEALYERVTERARTLSVSRSEFFARAARHYLRDLDRASSTARIDHALAVAGEAPEMTGVLAAGRSHLVELDDEW